MTIILSFDLSILNFCLEIFIHHIFSFDKFNDILTKTFKYLSGIFFKMWVKTISWSLILKIVSVFFIFGDMRDKKISKYI